MARHLAYLDRALTDIATGAIKRLIVQLPPRHGKSSLTSIYFPAWYLGTYPNKRVILATYGDDLATDFGRKARALMEEFGPSLFGLRVNQESRAANNWNLDGHDGGMISTGIGGPITGRGADLLVIDDYTKNAEEAISENQRSKVWDWYQSTASTRLEPEAAQVVMATRWHDDDLIGRILKGEEAHTWRVIRLPALAEDHEPDELGRKPGEALWPERWNAKELNSKRKSLDDFWWYAMYQQRPGTFGRFEWPDTYFHPGIWCPESAWPSHFDLAVMACDPSKGKESKRGDFSAIVWAGLSGERVYVDAWVERQPATEVVEQLVDWYCTRGAASVALEVNQFQELLIDDLQQCLHRRGGLSMPIEPINNTFNKLLRIRRLGADLREDTFRFADTPGCRLLVQQAREFPRAQHDDAVDALDMARGELNRLLTGGGQRDAIGQTLIGNIP